MTSDAAVAIVGDRRPDNETHLATDAALRHSAGRQGIHLDVRWVPTIDLAGRAADVLRSTDAVLVAPGSPYESMSGAIEAITVARMSGLPLLGTCGGFQHVVIEFARHVAGIPDAEHAEHDPYASVLLINALTCSLAGRTMDVAITDGTTARAAYGAATATERYYCNFGLDPQYLPALVAAGLVVSGTDQEGEARIIEGRGHPFFMGTLFVPQASSTEARPHPLVTAFAAAAADHARRRRVPVGSTP